MSMDKCRNCPRLEVIRSKGDGFTDKLRWETSELSVERLREQKLPESKTTIIYAEAGKIRDCSRCRESFIKMFKMPEMWWTTLYRRMNGYFCYEDTIDEQGNFDGYNTWSRFHIKQPIEARYEGETNFIWYKYNIFTRWIPDPNRSIFLIFDPLPSIRRQFLVPMLDSVPLYDLDDHFFIYTIIAAEVARLQDDAVWTIRGLIWTIENERTKSTVPNPDYPHLHDVSRFAIHTCETIDMAIQSIDNIISHHNSTMTQRPSFDNKINVLQKRIQNRLESHKIILIGLQSRSSSNKERIMNEIQLAFNSVAQFESRISVEIGRAAQIDSAAMKIVAFVTLVFFPATFVSGLFGMSFFEYDADGDNWSMSSEIWIFWLISFIVTAVTALCCAFWHKLFPPPQIGARKYESMLDEKK